MLGVMVMAWVALLAAGREHALQAVGLEIACLHPGQPGAAHAEGDRHAGAEAAHASVSHAASEAALPHGEADEAASAPDVDEGDDCPVGCSGCACGAALYDVPDPFGIAARFGLDGTYGDGPRSDRPRSAPMMLDRPPRTRA